MYFSRVANGHCNAAQFHAEAATFSTKRQTPNQCKQIQQQQRIEYKFSYFKFQKNRLVCRFAFVGPF